MSNPIYVADLSHLSAEDQPQSFQALYDAIQQLRNAKELLPGTVAVPLNMRFVGFFNNLTYLLPTQEELDGKFKDKPPGPPAYLVNGQSVWDRNLHEEFQSVPGAVWELELPSDSELLPHAINAVVFVASRMKLTVLSDSLGLGYMPPRTVLCAWGDPEEHSAMFDPPRFPAPPKPVTPKHPSAAQVQKRTLTWMKRHLVPRGFRLQESERNKWGVNIKFVRDVDGGWEFVHICWSMDKTTNLCRLLSLTMGGRVKAIDDVMKASGHGDYGLIHASSEYDFKTFEKDFLNFLPDEEINDPDVKKNHVFQFPYIRSEDDWGRFEKKYLDGLVLENLGYLEQTRGLENLANNHYLFSDFEIARYRSPMACFYLIKSPRFDDVCQIHLNYNRKHFPKEVAAAEGLIDYLKTHVKPLKSTAS
jgi:hypothetical protein